MILVSTILLTACVREQTTCPVRKPIVDAVFASGHISSENEYLVTANTEGYLTQVYVKEGDPVKTGSRLFRLSGEIQSALLANAQAAYEDALARVDPESPQLVQLKLKIDQAKTQLELDRKNFERYSRLLPSNAISRVDYDRAGVQYENSRRHFDIQRKALADLEKSLKLNLQNAKNQLKIQEESQTDCLITSSINGQVLTVSKKQGELVRKGETMAKIGGGETVIKLDIAEEDIRKIRLGQKAVISLNTDKDHLYAAAITKIYPAFDEKEQSFLAEATFRSDPGAVYAGTQLQANIIVDEKQDALIIPGDYLQNGDSVLLASGKKVAVKVGIKNNEWAEIVSGLQTTDKIKLGN